MKPLNTMMLILSLLSILGMPLSYAEDPNPLSTEPSTNPKFTLASNGVTCLCPEAEIGETGTLVIGE